MNWWQMLTFQVCGWHWVLAGKRGNLEVQGIFRLRVTPNGRPYFKCYGEIYFLDAPLPDKVWVMPLTWNGGTYYLPEHTTISYAKQRE